MARQRLGQHFLADPAVRKRIRGSLPLRPNDIWLEIDAERGEVSQRLLGESRHVIAVEPDPHLAARLKKRESEWPACLSSKGVFDLEIGSQWPVSISRQWRHPLHATSPILHHLFDFAPNVRSSTWSSSAKSPSALSLAPGAHPMATFPQKRTTLLNLSPRRPAETLPDSMRLTMIRRFQGACRE